MKTNVIDLSKQDVPLEDREYIDRPEDAPEGAEPIRGEDPGVWYYDTTDVREEDWPDEYKPGEWEDNIREHDGVEIGDGVDVFVREENAVYSGEVTGVDGDERGAYYEVTFEDGSSMWTTIDKLFIRDPVGPEEGEQISTEEYERGDTVRYWRFGDVQEEVVSRVEDGTIYTINDDGREVAATSSEYRARRSETKESATAEEIALTTDIDSKRDFKQQELRPKLGESIEQIEDDDVAKTTSSHVELVEYDLGDRNAWDSKEQKLMFKEDPSQDVTAHEYAHVLADSHGYDTDHDGKGINIVAKMGVRNVMPIEFGIPLGESVENALEVWEERMPAYDLTDDVRDMLSEERFDNVIEREDFMLTKRGNEEVPDEVDRLIDEVNKAWNDIMDMAQDGNIEKAHNRCPLRPYASTNAHEMLATVSQIAQSTTGDEAHLRTVWEFYPDMLTAYTDVYEPSEQAKQMLNTFYDNEAMEDIFEGKPYPEVEENED